MQTARLTATPAKHTYGFLNQNVVMEYPRAQALADGLNCDDEVRRSCPSSSVVCGPTVAPQRIRPGRAPLEMRAVRARHVRGARSEAVPGWCCRTRPTQLDPTRVIGPSNSQEKRYRKPCRLKGII